MFFFSKFFQYLSTLTLNMFIYWFQEPEYIGFNIGFLLTAFLSSILNLFMFCYYGKLATESFEKMANCLYESNWQRHPIAMQKCFLIMMKNAQKPLYYHGFNIVILKLETFFKVSKKQAGTRSIKKQNN